MLHRFYLWRLLIILALATLLTGCNTKSTVSRKTLDPAKAANVVAVGSQWYGHIPVWIGIEKGFFARQGLQVEWRFIGKSMDRMNAISSGDAQFASLGEIAMLASMSQGNKNFYWVGSQDIAPGFEGLVARSGINSIEQLRGKRVGFPFGSSVELTARMLLRQHGLNPDRDVSLINLEVGDVPAVFLSKNVDAALVWEPGFSQLKAVKGSVVLGMDTDTEIYRRFGTMTGPDVLVLSRAWVDAYPQKAKALLVAYFQALDWVKTHPQETVDLIVNTYILQDPALVRANIDKFKWQNAEDNQKVMSENGIFPQVRYILNLLYRDMRAIPSRPKFYNWVRKDLLPGAGNG